MIPARAQPLLALIVLFCGFPLCVLAQQNNEKLVFNVSVVDEEGKPVTDLKPENFSVWIDKKPRKVVSLQIENSPVSVGILLDVSGSIGPNGNDPKPSQRNIRLGMEHFLEVSNPANEYFAAVFDGSVALTESWTGASESLLSNLTAPGKKSNTALYDTLYYGIQRVVAGRQSRRVLLVITDGFDNGSRRSYKEVVKLMKRSDVSIYAMALYDDRKNAPTGPSDGLRMLEELTMMSGGRAIYLPYSATPDVVNSAFEIVATNLQNQYQLAIEKEDSAGPEKWRKLKLKLNLGDDKGKPILTIWSREGFYQ
jgi:Ca-activated chloride channel homolog